MVYLLATASALANAADQHPSADGGRRCFGGLHAPAQPADPCPQAGGVVDRPRLHDRLVPEPGGGAPPRGSQPGPAHPYHRAPVPHHHSGHLVPVPHRRYGSGWGASPRPAVLPASCSSPSPVGETRCPRHGDGCWWARSVVAPSSWRSCSPSVVRAGGGPPCSGRPGQSVSHSPRP